MASKTKEQIADYLIQYIQALRPDVDVSVGTTLYDIVVSPMASLLESVYIDIDNTAKAQSINYASEITTAQLDDQAANVNLTRLAASNAQGNVTLYRTTDPSPSTITIPQGTTISTVKNADGTYQSVVTLADTTITTSDYNALTGYWETDVLCEAVNPGTDGNVSTNTLTVVSVAGIDGCTNRQAFTSGTNQETNTALATRIASAYQARLLGTAPGYENLVEAISGVLDAVIVTPNDTERIRYAYGNEVDAVILGTDYASLADTNTFSATNGLTHIFTKKPVYSVSSVIDEDSVVYSENVDYVLAKDTSSDYRYTTQSLDKLYWLSSGTLPADGKSYDINFTYNKLVETVQDTLDLPTNKLIAGDVVAREATQVLVDISITVAIYSTVSKSYAEAQVKSTIEEYISSLGLGGKIEQADLIFELKDALSFIDNITIPFTKLARRGSSGVSDLTASKLEYFSTDSNSLVVTVI